jgi:aldose 1-epimerase
MSEIIIENNLLRLVVDPDKGACISAFFVNKENSWFSLMPDTRTGSSDLKAACFIMIPYSNRIENGRFNFEGKDYQLRNKENHAIHGDTRNRAWRIEGADSSKASFLFGSREHKDINWPWSFDAQVEYYLHQNIFTSKITVWNRSASVMPAGCGWHPYYNRTILFDEEPVYLKMNTRGVYPDAHDNRIPSGPPQLPGREKDFSEEKPLDRSLFLDSCYHGYDGNGYIFWPKSGIKATYKCSSCSHLLVFNPTKPFFAVEPVTNANNGVNLFSKEEFDSGIVPLAPNESLTASFSLQIDLL